MSAELAPPKFAQRPGVPGRLQLPYPVETPPLPLPQTVPLPEEPPVLLEEPPTPEPPTEPPDQTQVAVEKILVVGSTVFTPEDLAPVLAPYEDQLLTLAELQQAADAVTQLYLNRGYITSRAVLPNQTITDGLVQLQVLEGSLEAIQIEGAPRLANYVRNRIALGAGTPLNQVDLENQLRLLRADPLIDSIEASLRAGEGLGQSLLIVRVDPAPQWVAALLLDPDSPPSVGTVRTGAEVVYRNPLGLGDELRALGYRATTGGSDLLDLSYRVPLNARNGTLLARFVPSQFKVIEPTNLDVRGSAEIYELGFRQPLIRTPREEMALYLGFAYRNGKTQFFGLRDNTRTSVVQFAQDYLRRDVLGAWSVRSQLNFGTNWFNAIDLPGSQPDSQFFAWEAQVQRAQVITPNNVLIVQGDLQLASKPLLGSEQFVLGGDNSVRGYSQNARFGDNGLRLSIEDRQVLQRDENGVPLLQLVGFLDFGTVWNSRNGTVVNQQNTLLGTGLGILALPADNFNLGFNVGVPLIKLNEAGDSPQDVYIYLNLSYQL
jgi:hemolysin activation/secretion protein